MSAAQVQLENHGGQARLRQGESPSLLTDLQHPLLEPANQDVPDAHTASASRHLNLPDTPHAEVQLPSESSSLPVRVLPALIDALDVMQSRYFEIWMGDWPESIDWTGAVIATYISAALSTLSSGTNYTVSALGSSREPESEPESEPEPEALAVENLINRYFSQVTAYYFGQNAFRLRNEAYDDMLWVVLGWLETVKFINSHSTRHYYPTVPRTGDDPGYDAYAWYGTQSIPSLAHRARIFYDIAAQGWDTKLCGGGMIWSPYLRPYKNAITNQLYIAASVSMYLDFPGDSNQSPFEMSGTRLKWTAHQSRLHGESLPPAMAHDERYLKAAIETYDWLQQSNMTNTQGLYTDGYHVRTSNQTKRNTTCDDRNEMVYSYNQGVILSGMRGLWEGTGKGQYLNDGYAQVASVISATGWSDLHEGLGSGALGSGWAGLGRDGVLEDACDASGKCSQDAQTFKGIFFHHLTVFCKPLPREALVPGTTFAADAELAEHHRKQCASYASWITHNARAAYLTRDINGLYGMWWDPRSERDADQDARFPLPEGAEDYRNKRNLGRGSDYGIRPGLGVSRPTTPMKDPNERGRGRTVETQGGGVAILRAYRELVEKASSER